MPYTDRRKLIEAIARYRKTDKGRAMKARSDAKYRSSEKGREAYWRSKLRLAGVELPLDGK